MERPKILILQNELSAYNVCVYNIIAESYDLTVGFFLKDKSDIDCEFTKHKFSYYRIGPFRFIKGLRKFAKQFDVVSILPDPHNFSYFIFPFLPHKNKLLSWSIGFRCSYIHPYITDRKHTFFDSIYKSLYQKVDANIFYMEKSKEFWMNTNLDMSKVFVAPNTTGVEPIEINPDEKKIILFVGTLYRGKGLDLLLQSFKDAIQRAINKTKLVIVGGGEMRDELEKYVADNNMIDTVEFTGPIFDEKVLCRFFQKALLCVSPTQGGLSCPKSMGYGVPFVCRRDAITGGEVYHMTSGVNGIMYDNDSDLTDILVDAIDYPSTYVEMGVRAKNYYDNNATPRHMAQGAMDAINYVLSK